MYLTEAVLEPVRREFGVPREATAAAVFTPREFGLLQYCRRKNRAHDITLMIRDREGRFALIRKPVYPPGVFRPPSGGVEPGEAFSAGVLREAWEETGLNIHLERYLLRCRAEFSCGGETLPWTTHVFLARATTTVLDPQDRHEIAEACWATLTEMLGPYREAMLAMGSAGMRYRVDLQDLVLTLLGKTQWDGNGERLVVLRGEAGVTDAPT